MRFREHIAFAALIAAIGTCGELSAQRPDDAGRRERGTGRGPDSASPLVLGIVVELQNDSLSIETRDGAVEKLSLSEGSRFVSAAEADRQQIKIGDTIDANGDRSNTESIEARVVNIQEGIEPAAPPSTGREPQGHMRGRVTGLDPLTVETESKDRIRIEISAQTKIFRESRLERSEVAAGTRVVVVAPPRPGLSTREALKVIVRQDQGPKARQQDHALAVAADRQISLAVDFAAKSGALSSRISGVTSGPFYSEASFDLLQAANFKIVQIMLWISAPLSPADAANGTRFKPLSRDELKQNISVARRQIAATFKTGAEPLVFMILDGIPPSFEEFEKQVREVINELREGAMESGNDLRMFRFGNEPDLRAYRGVEEPFFDLYKAWAETVTSVSSNFLVQAPGFASVTARRWPDQYFGEVNEPTTRFLDSCKDHGTPLDVLSFHYYGASIEHLVAAIKVLAMKLEAYPRLSPHFGVPMIAIDEWNIEVFGMEERKYKKIFETSHAAAHNAAAMIEMARNGVWLSVRFGGTCAKAVAEGTPPAPAAEDFLMVHSDGRPKPVYHAFRAFNLLFSTPVLIGLDGAPGVYALAGIDPGGGSANILLSFYDEGLAVSSPGGEAGGKQVAGRCRLAAKHFPWKDVKRAITVTRRVVDDTRQLDIVETKVIAPADAEGDGFSMEFEAITPSVVLLQMTW